MSMLGSQCDELRRKAGRLDRASVFLVDCEVLLPEGWPKNAMDNASEAMREAATTITSLQNRLQELQSEVNHWRTEQVHAYGNWEDAYKRVIELEANNGTRWHELFGTPEKAARTLIEAGAPSCDECALRKHCNIPDEEPCMICHYGLLLEWLRGDAE